MPHSDFKMKTSPKLSPTSKKDEPKTEDEPKNKDILIKEANKAD